MDFPLSVMENFSFQERDPVKVTGNLNTAFLAALSGTRIAYPARAYLESFAEHDSFGPLASWYVAALDAVKAEIEDALEDEHFAAALEEAADLAGDHERRDPSEVRRILHQLFFPEGLGLPEKSVELAEELRERRTVTALRPGSGGLSESGRQILFTANILLGLPLEGMDPPPRIEEDVPRIRQEPQLHWFDHPIPLGAAPGTNEAIHGLRGLDDAMRFEAARGNLSDTEKVRVLLSASTTHEGLRDLVRPWLAGELKAHGNIEKLDLYLATEADVKGLLDEVLVPAAEALLEAPRVDLLCKVLGVDGEYGRHYSFLKAISALWQVVRDPEVAGTFKIDLDQVFPQEELVRETGESALEHLTTKLWGAAGLDSQGNEVELGMIAGSLVNSDDISRGLFTADVQMPPGLTTPEQLVFHGTLPQALSTEAEMVTRDDDEGPGGMKSCRQRVHVTGGTSGILVSSLRRHRPFTPSWVGRAEDQAYLLSVAAPQDGPALRYLHKPGLIMRHDKGSFLRDTIEAARVGKYIGDLVRMLLFTSMARAMPQPIAETKALLDPFTGCFISRTPLAVTALRLTLKAAGLYGTGDVRDREEADRLLGEGHERLKQAQEMFLSDPGGTAAALADEAVGWGVFYDLLDALETALAAGDEQAGLFRDRANEQVEQWSLDGAG
jgi:hypothetical protein